MKNTDSIAIVSGGLDSVTLLYDMLENGYTPHVVSFNYGQRHVKELHFARLTARNLGLPHDVIDLTQLTNLISNSALTSKHKFETSECVDDCNEAGPHSHHLDKIVDPIEVPDGHYAAETMKATVVPNRNMLMLSIAGAIAVNEKARCIGIGVHGGDHFIYPDCRPGFLSYVSDALFSGNEDFHNFEVTGEHSYDSFESGAGPIYAPFIIKDKTDIAARAFELGVPIHLTWSCYKGKDKHCGKCGTCVERLEAIDLAQKRWLAVEGNSEELFRDNWLPTTMRDNTEYEDTEFWKTAIKEGAKNV